MSWGQLVMDESEQRGAALPLLRVLRGHPTPAELAALVTVLAARAAAPDRAAGEPTSLWRDRAALLHAPVVPGPGSWRASGLPR